MTHSFPLSDFSLNLRRALGDEMPSVTVIRTVYRDLRESRERG